MYQLTLNVKTKRIYINVIARFPVYLLNIIMNIIFHIFLIITCMPYNFTFKYRIKIHSSIINEPWIFIHLKKISKNAQNAILRKLYKISKIYCWNFQRAVLGFIQFSYCGLIFLFILQSNINLHKDAKSNY